MVKQAKERQRMALTKSQIYAEITDERRKQDAQWGGEKHDRTHTSGDWLRFIEKQLGLAQINTFGRRERFVKIAALCVAKLEAEI